MGCAAPRNLVNLNASPRTTAPVGARRRHARRRRRRADRRRRAQRRRASRPCCALIAGARTPDAGRGHADRRPARRRSSGSATRSTRRARSARSCVGGRAEHEWAGDARVPRGARRAARRRRDRRFPTGSTRRSPRSPAASGAGSRSPALLLGTPELLLLDEPTNHLDVEAHRLAGRAPGGARRGALLVVTHDRWFLDAVCTTTWEVADGAVHALRGRLRGLRAGAGRARPPGGGRARTAGRTCCARSWPGCAAGRRPGRPSRSSGSRRPTR